MNRLFKSKKKVLENGKSEIFEKWKKYGNISKEDFIKELEWLCDDPYDEYNRVTRELGYEVDMKMIKDDSKPLGDSLVFENGRFYHLQVIHDDSGILTAFYYDDPRAGKNNHTLWCKGRTHDSISARDRI